MTKFRRGDIVSVKGKVKFDQTSDDDTIHIEVGYTPVYLKPEAVTLIHPTFNIGDPVRHACGATGSVKSIDADQVWIRLNDGGYATYAAADLRFVEETSLFIPEEAPPAPPDIDVMMQAPIDENEIQF